MAGLQYPRHKLRVVLRAEEWDIATQQMFGLAGGSGGVVPPGQLVSGATEEEEEELRLPAYASVVLSVPGAPGTKPSACDFGLFRARGDYTVIFDTEDSPDPQMLLKAVRDFRNASPRVACLQPRLLFWNILPVRLPSPQDWATPTLPRISFVEYAV